MNLPAEANLGDVHPWAASLKAAAELVAEGKAPAFLCFVENSAQLKSIRKDLKAIRKQKIDFWIAYPQKPYLGTDLSSEKVHKLTHKVGLKGRVEEVIGIQWSAIYFARRKAK